jgi:hypothetical protein
MLEQKNVGTISTAISTNSTFHKNVVTFLKNVERILKRENKCPTILKMLKKVVDETNIFTNVGRRL